MSKLAFAEFRVYETHTERVSEIKKFTELKIYYESLVLYLFQNYLDFISMDRSFCEKNPEILSQINHSQSIINAKYINFLEKSLKQTETYLREVNEIKSFLYGLTPNDVIKFFEKLASQITLSKKNKILFFTQREDNLSDELFLRINSDSEFCLKHQSKNLSQKFALSDALLILTAIKNDLIKLPIFNEIELLDNINEFTSDPTLFLAKMTPLPQKMSARIYESTHELTVEKDKPLWSDVGLQFDHSISGEYDFTPEVKKSKKSDSIHSYYDEAATTDRIDLEEDNKHCCTIMRADVRYNNPVIQDSRLMIHISKNFPHFMNDILSSNEMSQIIYDYYSAEGIEKLDSAIAILMGE